MRTKSLNREALEDLEGKPERVLLWGLGGLSGSVFNPSLVCLLLRDEGSLRVKLSSIKKQFESRYVGSSTMDLEQLKSALDGRKFERGLYARFPSMCSERPCRF